MTTTATGGVACLEILDPGLLTTVQDLGRPGLGALGITPGGAADPHSLIVANLLLGNPPGAAALEVTLAGVRLRARHPLTLAIAGADLGAHVVDTGEPVAAGRTVHLREGQALAFDGRPSGGPGGCRAYIAIPGGVDVPPVLGSRATALGATFGGYAGRALDTGDLVAAATSSARGATAGPGFLDRPPAHWTGPVTDPAAGPIRVLPGPAAQDAAGHVALEGLARQPWTVSPASDRIGLRLAGSAPAADAGGLPSHGVIAGTVQLPPDGRPIVLLADHQPTGGYPVIAVVASADRPRLGQLAPGADVAFRVVDEAQARRLAAAWREATDAAVEHLREAQAWDALWRGAGG